MNIEALLDVMNLRVQSSLGLSAPFLLRHDQFLALIADQPKPFQYLRHIAQYVGQLAFSVLMLHL
ncbi:hypothetical protein AA042_13835 [Pseudomonas lundensis]|nr:hypothetical protein AA042_13835 [Pseudomonas lundensis]